MNNNEITATMNEITARENAMKKEEEKKMTTATTETMSETRKALRKTALAAAKKLDETRATKEKSTWKEGMDVSEALNNALAALNADMLEECYETALKSDCPVATLAKMLTYPKWYAKTNKKDNVTTLETRATRLNVLDFLKWAAESEKYDAPKNADAIITALADTARKLADYVLASITGDKASIRATLPAMEKLFKTMGLDIHANGKDVRFIAYAATRARGLGELAEITERTITPFIIDVISIRERGVEYKFEEKKEEEKA